MSIETIRISEKARTQLITLKRRTGIKNWNILCRWAFCVSLSESSKPPVETLQTDSSIEMTWKVFAGINTEVYLVLLKQRCKQDGFELNNKILNEQFKLHLHRGIAYLVGNTKLRTISALLNLA